MKIKELLFDERKRNTLFLIISAGAPTREINF